MIAQKKKIKYQTFRGCCLFISGMLNIPLMKSQQPRNVWYFIFYFAQSYSFTHYYYLFLSSFVCWFTVLSLVCVVRSSIGLFCLFVYSFVVRFVHLFVLLFVSLFVHLFVLLFIRSFVRFVYLFIRSLFVLFICLFIRCLFCLLVYSFICSFVHLTLVC